uniref:Uncharacterized protein n=1 Tax=Avena sativa TaxID=4498 RepID=A0ACD5YI20_AVESA
MMLTAMQHMDSSAYASPSSASPWQKLLPAQLGHLPSYEDLASAPAATATHQTQHRAARRIAKRRPRPSRRLPTTYISADPTEFRRMVHQVTGADELLLLPTPSPQQAEEPLLLPTPAGRASASVAGGTGRVLLLPTLDTSAFLLGGGCRVTPAAARTDALPPPPPPPCDGDSLALDNTSGGSSHCGFPTLESWHLL